MNRRIFPRTLAVAIVGIQAVAPQYAADTVVHLTLTDDFPMAHAVVVISVEAAGGGANSA